MIEMQRRLTFRAVLGVNCLICLQQIRLNDNVKENMKADCMPCMDRISDISTKLADIP